MTTAATERLFPETEFDCLHDVPVFKEHVFEQETDDGQTIRDRYTARELQFIVDNNNRLIEDTGDYVPIVIAHTDPDNKQFDPPVVGFAGPFKLGKYGKLDPKATIYAVNWWIRKDAANQVKRYPRRSVELWREDRYEDRFFDPISLLGAHTPRLSLGLVGYGRSKHGKQVMRYSAVLPSGGNTFVPAFGGEKKRHYSLDGIESPEPDALGDSNMLGEEDITKIVGALEQTDVFQWARSQMSKDDGLSKGMDEELDDSVTATDAAPALPAAGGAALAAPAMDSPIDGDDEPVLNNEPMDGDEAEGGKVQYARGDRKQKDHYARMERENRELKARVEAIEKDKVKAVRYSRLQTLARERVLDPDEEIAEVLEMSEAQWDKHQDRILNRYEMIPVGGRPLPYERPALRLEAPDDAKSAEIAEKARALCDNERKAGRKITYGEARDRVVAQLKTA